MIIFGDEILSINRLERSCSRSRLPLKYDVHVPHAHVHVRDRVELKIGITNKLNMLNAINLIYQI